MIPKMFAVVLVAIVLAGCTSAAESEPGPTMTVTTPSTQTTTTSPRPTGDVELQYAHRLVNMSNGFFGATSVYMDAVIESFKEYDWQYGQWAATHGADESRDFMHQLNETLWAPPTDRTAEFRDLLVTYAVAKLTYWVDLDGCFAEHANGDFYGPSCDRVFGPDMDATKRALTMLQAEIALWEPDFEAGGSA